MRGRFLVQPALLAAEAIVEVYTGGGGTHDYPVFLTLLQTRRFIGSWRDHWGIAMPAGLVAQMRRLTIAPMSVGIVDCLCRWRYVTRFWVRTRPVRLANGPI